MTSGRLCVALVWHMHQPYYRDDVTGQFLLPWVRRRAAKDYLHMLALLERHPGVRVTMNFVPSLLLQLEMYSADDVADADRDLCLRPAAQLTAAERRFLMEEALRNDYGPRVAVLAPLMELLAELRGGDVANAPLGAIRDLQVWSLLAWIDPGDIAADEGLGELAARGRGFREADKADVDARQLALLRQVIPRFRAAVQSGQVEPLTSPLHHPILPLLIHSEAAGVAHPDMALPEPRVEVPDDASEQVRRGLAEFARLTGTVAAGMWPPECALSPAAARLLRGCDVRFAVSDEGVLARTIGSGAVADVRASGDLYAPHADAGGLVLVFRDADLSNRIGFVYQSMEGDAAAADLVGRLEEIAAAPSPGGDERLLTLALDGENFKDFYEENGGPFLDSLYRRLAASDVLVTTGVGAFLDANPTAVRPLPELWTGSWIDADLRTWIGEPAHNRAWELLGAAHAAVAAAGGPAGQAAAHAELLIAEGSDWFWWFGPHHDSGNDGAWDELFRTHVRNAYQRAGLPVPAAVDEPLLRGGPPARDCPPLRHVDPPAGGEREWAAAGVAEVGAVFGAMRPPASSVGVLRYGAGGGRLHLRFGDHSPSFDRAVVDAGPLGSLVLTHPVRTLSVVAPRDQPLALAVTLEERGRGIERVPARGALNVRVSDVPPVRVVICAAECAPLASAGALADAVAATAAEAAALAHDVVVLIPRHRGAGLGDAPGLRIAALEVAVAGRTYTAAVIQGRLPGTAAAVLSIDIPELFDRPAIYGAADDGERYLGFGAAVVAVLRETCFDADVVHGFEWQGGVLLSLCPAPATGPARVLSLSADSPSHRVPAALAVAAGLAASGPDVDLLDLGRGAADAVADWPSVTPLAELYTAALLERRTATV